MNIVLRKITQPRDFLTRFVGIKCDGTDETTLLQQALDYARDNSVGKISFPRNKTIVVSSTVNIHEGLNIIGNGCTIKLADNSDLLNDFIRFKEYTHTKGLKVDGNRANNIGSGGVRLYSNSVFEGNEVFNVSGYSVFTYKGVFIQILDNIIHDSDQYGISTGGDVGEYADNIIISGNTLYNCNAVGIKFRWCSNSLATKNTIIVPDLAASGIKLYDDDGPNTYVTIDDNTIIGAGITGSNVGIDSDGIANDHIVITNNKIDKVYRGIVVSFPGAYIVGNEVNNCRWTGIWLCSDAADVENNALAQAGIIVNTDSGSANTANNIIKNNTITGGNGYWRAANTGVYLWGTTTGTIIDGNDITTSDYNIKITSDEGSSTDTQVINNALHNASSLWISDDGINTTTSNNTES